MQLRHCPLNAMHEGVAHIDCHACDNGKGIDGMALIDRKHVAFPLRRLREEDGCIVRILNSVPLSVLKHIEKLPKASAWRLIHTDEDKETMLALIKAYQAAADGEPDRSLFSDMQTTSGHYFRGVE